MCSVAANVFFTIEFVLEQILYYRRCCLTMDCILIYQGAADHKHRLPCTHIQENTFYIREHICSVLIYQGAADHKHRLHAVATRRDEQVREERRASVYDGVCACERNTSLRPLSPISVTISKCPSPPLSKRLGKFEIKDKANGPWRK